MTTRGALYLERALVAQLNTAAGTMTELGYLMSAVGEKLSKEQRTAVSLVLNSGDRAVALRGRAGTGIRTSPPVSQARVPMCARR